MFEYGNECPDWEQMQTTTTSKTSTTPSTTITTTITTTTMTTTTTTTPITTTEMTTTEAKTPFIIFPTVPDSELDANWFHFLMAEVFTGVLFLISLSVGYWIHRCLGRRKRKGIHN